MYQKKVYRKRLGNTLAEPEIQYINIYNKPIKRLGCFADLTKEEDNHRRNKSLDQSVHKTSTNYFYGDAQSYEKNLDGVLKQLYQGVIPSSSMIIKENYYP